ncbi:MAG TPA: chorismate-binding protein [Kineosporiaceae bacterium]|nr:chorismate-binding protein [Kineosporiaceae bacterium]
MTRGPGRAWFGGLLAEGVTGWSNDPADLDRGGWWAVVMTFEGTLSMWRFDRVRPADLPDPEQPWPSSATGPWTSSLGRDAYICGVSEIRRRIREGEVYQVNLCRVMSAPVRPDAGPWALAAVLAAGNPAPYAGVIDVPDGPGAPGARLVSASPELFLDRDGDVVRSGPIKGTAPTVDGLLPKDEAENVMIVDLVRNDLQRVCRPGGVDVPELLAVHPHPGLVHLVSTVRGRLADGAGWPELLAVTMPPGSVSGAPKSSALRAIADLEPVPRGPYCGAVGWVDADRGAACLAVGIRTFWWDVDRLCFGTGAGITWGSDPLQEWEETRLKARRLVALASGGGAGGPDAHGPLPAGRVVAATGDGWRRDGEEGS